jgi:tetratricopeptide (TPR) repeat protein
LVRGYANLGLLTGYLVAPAHKVFLARSLLYAERLCAREHNSAWALWHRAYARALTGVHAAAIDDLEAADKLPPDRKRPRPDWVDLIDAFCRFDEARLSAAAEQEQLGAALRLRSLVFAKRYAEVTETAEGLLQKCPDSYFAIDAIYELRSMGTGGKAAELGPSAADEWLNKRLAAMGGAVAEVVNAAEASDAKSKEKGKSDPARIQLVRILRAAGSVEADRDEPSLSALAALVEDLTFLHAMVKIEFYGDMLSMPVDKIIDEARPLVADHPLGAFIEAQSNNFERRRKAAKVIRESDAIAAMIEDTLQPLAIALHQVDPELFGHMAKLSQSHNDRVFYDLLRMDARYGTTPEMKMYLSKLLGEVSPYAPTTVALQITHDWSYAEKHAAEWEKRYSTSPEVLNALGTRYQQLKRYDDAERCLLKRVETAPDFAGYRNLSNLYWQKGDVARWIEACDDALEQPSFGLEHARMRTSIANYYVARKEYDAALPYAAAAAQTGAAWAMLCEASVWEGKQDWQRAERLVRYTVERYAEIPLPWICFCRRTGTGDLQAASRIAEQFIERAEAKQGPPDNVGLAVAYMMLGKTAQALKPLRDEFMATKNPSPGMMAALVADQLNDVEVRDQILGDVVAYGPRFKLDNGEPRKELLRLAQWLVDDLKKGGKAELDLTAVDALFAITDENERLIANHLTGRYLFLHGKRDAAITYWKRAMGSTELASPHRSLAGLYLHELGVDAADYQKELLAKPPGLKGVVDK